MQPSLRATPVTERASDSAKDCESLVDARQDGIGHDAEHGAEKDASSEEICQKPVDMGHQFPRCFAIVATRHCRNTGDVPLYAVKHDAQAQEYGAHREVDAEKFSALGRAIRNEEAGDHERTRNGGEAACAEIEESEDNNHGSDRHCRR
jgi:hypothetical protein